MNWLLKRLHGVLLLACAALFYLPLGSRPLWQQEELIADVARGIRAGGEWMVHPPLMHWLTAGSFAGLGETVFAARFWSATFGVLTIYLVLLFGRKWLNERAGLLAGCVLATSGLFFGLTQMLSPDMAFTFWIMLALHAGAGMMTERLPERVRRFSTLFAIALAGGFLTNGWASLVLPPTVLLLALAYKRSWSQMSKIPWQEILLCTVLFITPWCALLAVKHTERMPQLFAFHVGGAPLYFVPVAFLAAFLPWSVFLPNVAAELLKHHGTEMKREPVKALLFLWSVLFVLIYAVLRTSQPACLLPVLPALALLCGSKLDQALEVPRSPGWFQQGLLALAFLFSVGVVLLKLPPFANGNAAFLCLVLSVVVMVMVGVWGMRQLLPAIAGIVISTVIIFGALTMLAPLLFAQDREMTDVPLPKLVLQPEPPRGVRLPDPIVKNDEWRGVQCGVQEPRFAEFHDAEKWTAFWQKAMAPYSEKMAKTPDVDFTKDMVVGVFLGDKPTPNFEVLIKKVRLQENPGDVKTLVVLYREVKKMQAVFAPPFSIQPFHLKKVPNFEGEIKFEFTRH